jgi:hypothetical protein
MRTAKHRFALCVDSRDYEASLVAGKVYPVLADAAAAKEDLLRVIDEDGEDYLFPQELFVLVELPPAASKRLLAMAGAA